jgi:diguanylate cyclase (GGDEF)-like protein/PAS domain S-box-containing protein
VARPAFDNEFHKAIVDNLHDGVYYVDRDRRITYWNHGAERISGYAAAEVVGRGCRDDILNHTDDTGRVLCRAGCPVAKTLADGRPREAHVFLHHRDGARIPVAVRVAPITDRSGAIVGAVEIFGDDRERQVTEERLQELRRVAVLDPLTGVGNRRWVEMTVRARLDDLERYGHAFGVLFVDVDRFKQVNDRHGHETGDAVLRAVATTTAAAMRGTDSVGRWGGDEFVAVCPAADADGLRRAGERVRSLVAAVGVPAEGVMVAPTVSVGGAVATSGDDVGTLLARADDAMYRSKQDGRDTVTIDVPVADLNGGVGS